MCGDIGGINDIKLLVPDSVLQLASRGGKEGTGAMVETKRGGQQQRNRWQWRVGVWCNGDFMESNEGMMSQKQIEAMQSNDEGARFGSEHNGDK